MPNGSKKRRSARAAATRARTALIPAIASSRSEPVSDEFAADVKALEAALGLPVWLLMQDAPGEKWNALDSAVSRAFYDARRTGLLPRQRIALVIDSNGGRAEDAFEVAKILQRHCGGFVAVIPRHAKSAATLLSLGAARLLARRFDAKLAKHIAEHLVSNYPTHSFVIDSDEAREIGLQIADCTEEQTRILDRFAQHCEGIAAIGPLIERIGVT